MGRVENRHSAYPPSSAGSGIGASTRGQVFIFDSFTFFQFFKSFFPDSFCYAPVCLRYAGFSNAEMDANIFQPFACIFLAKAFSLPTLFL